MLCSLQSPSSSLHQWFPTRVVVRVHIAGDTLISRMIRVMTGYLETSLWLLAQWVTVSVSMEDTRMTTRPKLVFCCASRKPLVVMFDGRMTTFGELSTCMNEGVFVVQDKKGWEPLLYIIWTQRWWVTQKFCFFFYCMSGRRVDIFDRDCV